VIDTSKVVSFGGPAHLTKAGTEPPAQPRLLMLKSPMVKGDDVRALQQALNQRNHAGLATDGVYGPATRDAVLNWQRREHIEVDGIVGPETKSSLGLPA
jgi:peptidoglycan hydrolase-like protein with peptidoglycan-binding domain